MAGKIGGVIAVAALVGALFVLAAPGGAADGECGPVTLDQLFPHLDVNGNPLSTTTTIEPAPETSAVDTSTTTTSHTSTTTTPLTSTTTTPLTSTTSEGVTTTTGPPEAPPPSEPSPPAPCTSWVYEMEWPVPVESRVFSGFGVDRDGGARRHLGNDIVAPKMAPVVAVADGTIASVHSTPPDDCCWLLITHDDGWKSLYVHLNNDILPADDGLGHGVRPGLEDGDPVVAGQVIGWIGDSGNAEHTVPHLHFELRHPAGYSVDPYASLQAARAATGDLTYGTGPYLDIQRAAARFQLSWLVSRGIYLPCDERGLMFCPDSVAQPEDAGSMIEQMTGLVAPLVPATERPLRFQEIIPEERVLDVLGCASLESCRQSGITTGDLARLALWANLAQRHLAADVEFDPASDLPLVDGRRAEHGLRALGVIGVCDAAVEQDRLLSRSEMAQLLTRWLLGDGADCSQLAAPTS